MYRGTPGALEMPVDLEQHLESSSESSRTPSRAGLEVAGAHGVPEASESGGKGTNCNWV
jgi:hypothetical protein